MVIPFGICSLCFLRPMLPPVASLLLKHSKDSDLINTYSASSYNLPEMFDALIGTPLHWAIQTNSIGVVKGLPESGAKINVHFSGLLSPVGLAASLRLYSILEILLEHASLKPIDIKAE